MIKTFHIYYVLIVVKSKKQIAKTQPQIIEAEWKGKVKKKYMGYDKPNINMFDLVTDKNKVATIDISLDKSRFFDLLMPRDSVYKSKGSNKVRIKNYTKDTTIVLNFN